MNFLTIIESFFAPYSIAKEILLIVFGAIFGGVCTVIINNGAMRKQCKFDMQHKILTEETDNISNIYKKLENIEIKVSFASGKTEQLECDIEEMQTLLLVMVDRLRKKRKFVRNYISAFIVEQAEQYPLDFKNIFYMQGKTGFYDLQLLPKISSEKLEDLRKLVANLRNLNNKMDESTEKLISPSVFSFLARKIRVPIMFIEKLNAIKKMHNGKK